MAEKIVKDIPQCPFFSGVKKKGTAKYIVCESPIPGATMSLYFRRIEDFETQYRLFCCQNYEKCEIGRMLLDTYEDA